MTLGIVDLGLPEPDDMAKQIFPVAVDMVYSVRIFKKVNIYDASSLQNSII